ncbi:hypothetical protein AB0C29_36365 [Actinoplanes sp. NPDC048791]|uniref:hypothetical protein n=1 Tax=Actinoplanes sp. NPDC048791 TaxID=3154623 RepID=UPI0033E68779
MAVVWNTPGGRCLCSPGPVCLCSRRLGGGREGVVLVLCANRGLQQGGVNGYLALRCPQG